MKYIMILFNPFLNEPYKDFHKICTNFVKFVQILSIFHHIFNFFIKVHAYAYLNGKEF